MGRHEMEGEKSGTEKGGNNSVKREREREIEREGAVGRKGGGEANKTADTQWQTPQWEDGGRDDYSAGRQEESHGTIQPLLHRRQPPFGAIGQGN